MPITVARGDGMRQIELATESRAGMRAEEVCVSMSVGSLHTPALRCLICGLVICSGWRTKWEKRCKLRSHLKKCSVRRRWL